MSTLIDCAKAFIHRWWKVITILLVLLIAILILSNDKLGATLEALTPPNLPKLDRIEEQRNLAQNWSDETRKQFHHITQGTRTLPIPYDWFVSLPKPSGSKLGILFSTEEKFMDNDYLLRFGFIKSDAGPYNPDGLPIGFAKTPIQSLPGQPVKQDAIGFTCAACHTGQLIVDNVQYVVEGGTAATDLSQFTKALGAALGQVALSSKIPVFNGRFETFARNVLQEQYSDTTKLALQNNLIATLGELQKDGDVIEVHEGFTRIDALNRIGNQVFSDDLDRRHNYAPINAPVNFPHIWTSSWFNWVQYDGSIMQPLIRNAGEALGVQAYLDVKSPEDEKRFASSIPMNNLVWIEHSLSGDAPYPQKAFNGLQHPKWPETFTKPQPEKVQLGEKLYEQHCEGCHLPPVESEQFWSDEYFKPIKWVDAKGNQRQTEERLVKVKVIPQKQIGTDPAQGNVLVERMVDTSGNTNLNTTGMGLNTDLCSWSPAPPLSALEVSEPKNSSQLVTVPLRDGSNISFALALGATVQQTIDAWYQQNYISPELQKDYQGDRPNCLQAGKGYRARPLNGIWATAPFLHNSSVPTLMDMLVPVEQRPKYVQLGSTVFDMKNVGIHQDSDLDFTPGELYSDDGLFILDTTQPGNSNKGHEFSDAYNPEKPYWQQPKGVIGPAFNQEEREAIVEFLKTL